MRFDDPILSVILPVYNCEKFVAQAIKAILDQTFRDFELLIADDGSSDSSRKIIDGFVGLDKRIRVFHQAKNHGKVSLVNNLYTFCRGRFITVHDADDFSHPDRFEKQLLLLHADSTLIMCGTAFRIVLKNGKHFKNVVMPSDFHDIVEGIWKGSQFHGPTMMFRRDSLGEVIYRPFFNGYNEDCDLALRLIERGPCTNLPDILYTYRVLPDSLSKSITAQKKNFYKMALEFHRQRKFRGYDDLMEGRYAEVQERLEFHMKPYLDDPSLIHRENAAFFMYYKLFRKAVFTSWRGCVSSPLSLENWRTLQYCVRKILLKI